MAEGLNKNQQMVKRLFDIFFSFIGMLIFIIPLIFLILFASFSVGKWAWFTQERIGMNGRKFNIYKIRTMRGVDESDQSITVAGDPRITAFGRFLRRFKFDELPQLLNVLKGEMSLVGPRPDVEGYADKLSGEDRIILSVRPGITGPATLKFKDEEQILANQPDPVKYNDEIIWPEKVRLNVRYVHDWSLWKDIVIIYKTLF